MHFSVSGKVDNKICHAISVCLRFAEVQDEHTQPPLILESIMQSYNSRVSSKPHESILLSEGGRRFFILDEVCLLENFDGILVAGANVSCELYLVCAIG